MKVLGIHHVNIRVRDVDAAMAFYVGALGLSPRTDRPSGAAGGAWLDAGHQQIHLSLGEPPEDLGEHFALEVDDLAAAMSGLETRGFEVTRTSSATQAVVLDPSGNRVEIRQAPAL